MAETNVAYDMTPRTPRSEDEVIIEEPNRVRGVIHIPMKALAPARAHCCPGSRRNLARHFEVAGSEGFEL